MPRRTPRAGRSKADALETVIDSIYAVALEGAAWDAFLDGASSLLRGGMCDLVAHDFARQSGRQVVATPTDPHFVAAYEAHFAPLNPWLARPRRAFADTPIQTGAEVVPPDELEKTEFYTDWLAPQDFHHRIAGIVDRKGPRILYFGVFRSKREPAFEAEEIRVCRTLSQHLQRTVRLRRTFPALGNAALVREVVDRLPYGVICLDAGGTPWLVNHIARAILDQRDGLSLEPTGLRPTAARHAPAFQRMIGAALAPGRDARQAETRLRLPRPERAADLVVIAVPLRNRDILGGARTGAALFVLDPERSQAISTDALQQQFELTPAEARFASLLAQGRTLDDVAEELHITRNTARAHLQHIFLKTGVSRQAHLVQLVLTTGLALASPAEAAFAPVPPRRH